MKELKLTARETIETLARGIGYELKPLDVPRPERVPSTWITQYRQSDLETLRQVLKETEVKINLINKNIQDTKVHIMGMLNSRASNEFTKSFYNSDGTVTRNIFLVESEELAVLSKLKNYLEVRVTEELQKLFIAEVSKSKNIKGINIVIKENGTFMVLEFGANNETAQ